MCCAARARLRVRDTPYWRMIGDGQHLGCRKGSRGGTWIARHRPTGTQGTKLSLGHADDVGDANGGSVLNWREALDKATPWFQLQDKGDTQVALNPDISVADARSAVAAVRRDDR